MAEPALPIATRPNSITIANGRVWVLSTKSGEIVVLDGKTSRQIDRLSVGQGGSAVAGGFGSVWAVKRNTRALIRLERHDPPPHRLRRRSPSPGSRSAS